MKKALQPSVSRRLEEWPWKVPGNYSAFLSSFRTIDAGKQNVANTRDI